LTFVCPSCFSNVKSLELEENPKLPAKFQVHIYDDLKAVQALLKDISCPGEEANIDGVVQLFAEPGSMRLWSVGAMFVIGVVVGVGIIMWLKRDDKKN
jgi:hypothetical protein